MPTAEQRLQLWRKAFGTLPLDSSVDLAVLAKRCELSGGSILNVIRYIMLHRAKDGKAISQAVLLDGIKREQVNEGKPAKGTIISIKVMRGFPEPSQSTLAYYQYISESVRKF